MAAIPPSLLQMFGPIESLLTDPTVRRVLVDAPDAVLVERHGRMERTPLAYPPAALEESLEALARRAGKPFDGMHPSLEAQLKDGTRFLALRPPAVERGPLLVVVRPGGRLTDLPALVRQGALTAAAAGTLSAAVVAGLNIAVVGPSDSGRTTLLEALAATLPRTARVAVIEEHAELRLPEREPLRFQTRKPEKDGSGAVTTGDILYFAGRMAVDRVILGDLRWQDASECVHLLSGRLTPVLMALPGLDATDALARLEALAKASATGGRDRAVAGLLQAGVDLVVTLGRLEGQRVVMAVERVLPGREGFRLESLYGRAQSGGWALEAEPSAEALTARWQAAAPPEAPEDSSIRETLGYLPAIPLMTDTHRLPESQRRPEPLPEAPASPSVITSTQPAAAGLAPLPTPALTSLPAAESPRLSLGLQTPGPRAPLPTPRGATMEPEVEPAAPPPPPGDPLATDNMFATLRPAHPAEPSDPLRRLLQGLKSEPAVSDPPIETAPTADLGAALPPVPPETPPAPAEGPLGEDDEEKTMINDPVPTATARDDVDGEPRAAKTFSQVLRTIGVGPGESQEVSGVWTGMNAVPRRTSPATADVDMMEETRESDAPVQRTTKVHATDE